MGWSLVVVICSVGCGMCGEWIENKLVQMLGLIMYLEDVFFYLAQLIGCVICIE